jgi:hypothetical protein|nr:MAG TPA: hypothetical protein [Caudoviricetes sp.]
MKIDNKLLNRVEEGMAFAKIAFLLVFGLVCISFKSLAYSDFGSKYFTKSWAIDYLDWLGIILIAIALAHFIHGTYTLFRYGGIAFSGKSALERWRREWELLITLHFLNKTGVDMPELLLSELRKRPDGLEFFEEFFLRLSSAEKDCPQNSQQQSPQKESA